MAIPKPLKRLLNNALENPRTSIPGVLAIASLFTPISPVVGLVGAALISIFGAVDPGKASLPSDKPK